MIEWISITILLRSYPLHQTLHVPTAVALLKNSHNEASADLFPPLIHSVTACAVKYISNAFLLQGIHTARETSWDSPPYKHKKEPPRENGVRSLSSEPVIFESFVSRWGGGTFRQPAESAWIILKFSFGEELSCLKDEIIWEFQTRTCSGFCHTLEYVLFSSIYLYIRLNKVCYCESTFKVLF